MKSVWKFAFEVNDDVEIVMPTGAEILVLDVQFEKPCIWALVDPEAPTRQTRRFRIFGTGHEIPDDFSRHSTPTMTGWTNPYVGSFTLLNGRFIGHVFEVLP